MVSNYTTPALAGALRDREDTLQLAAALLAAGDMDNLRDVLSPHESKYIEVRRRRRVHLDLTDGFKTRTLEMLRKYLARMPRQVTKAHRHRAAIVLPLCNVDGVPSVLFEKVREGGRCFRRFLYDDRYYVLTPPLQTKPNKKQTQKHLQFVFAPHRSPHNPP